MFGKFAISSADLKNNLINMTYEPILVILIVAVPLEICVIGSLMLIAICCKAPKEKLKLKPVPKKKIKDDGKKEKYSDEHLIVKSNINERLKIFDKKNSS